MGPYGFYRHATDPSVANAVPWQDLRGYKVLIDGNGLLFHLKDLAFGPSRGRPHKFLQHAGAFHKFYITIHDYLTKLTEAGVELAFVFDSSMRVDNDHRFKAATGSSRLLQTRESMFKVQRTLLNITTSTSSKRRDNTPDPPHCPLLSTQFRSCVEEMGFKVLRITGEADYFMALQVGKKKAFDAVLAGDADFLVFSGCKAILFDFLDLTTPGIALAKVFDPMLIARSLGLPPDEPQRLAELAVLVGCDYTRHKKGRAEVLRHFGLTDNLKDIAEFVARRTEGDREAMRRFLTLEGHKELLEAADYTMELYALQQPYPEEQDQSEAVMAHLVNQGVPEFLCHAVVREKASSLLVTLAREGKWTGPCLFETITARATGARPSAVVLTAPLRSAAYSLLGKSQVVEELMISDSITKVTVPVPSLDTLVGEYDQGSWQATLAGVLLRGDDSKLSQHTPTSFLLVLVTTAHGFPRVPQDQDPLTTNLHQEGLSNLFSVALTLRCMIYASAKGISHPYRLKRSELKALIATIAQCYASTNGTSATKPAPSVPPMSGPIVLKLASLSTWYLYTLQWVRDLRRVVGLGKYHNVSPRAMFDVEVFATRLLSPNDTNVEGSSSTQNKLEDLLWECALAGLSTPSTDGEVITAFSPEDEDQPVSTNASYPQGVAAGRNGGSGNWQAGGEDEEVEDEDEEDKAMGMEDMALARGYLVADEPLDVEALEMPDMTSFSTGTTAAPELPIMSKRQLILETIAANPVVIIQGETGCGKSSQVPQFIIKNDPLANVVVTTPTRMAAITLAKRVSQELGDKELGHSVGYRIGNERVDSWGKTRITFVTAGWLLQWLTHQKDSNSLPFTHIILDEVHERSIESDLLCFLLKTKILASSSGDSVSPPRLVLMSATMQSLLFSEYFLPVFQEPQQPGAKGKGRGGRKGSTSMSRVPTLPVGARSPFQVYEVYLEELRDLCPSLTLDLDTSMYIDNMCHRFGKEPRPAVFPEMMQVLVKFVLHVVHPGETALCFVAGMSDIEDLYALFHQTARPLEVIAFHSQISMEDQLRAFEENPALPKIILATNIAESSVTIPRVKYVIDFGVCKNLRYDRREHRTVLGYSWVSQASANQRRGRTGRVCDGYCIRLFTRSFFEGLPPHDDAEIVTKPLDSVLLQLKIMNFPNIRESLQGCITPPDDSQVTGAASYLQQIGALETEDIDSAITPLAYLMAGLGLDLPLARMVVLGVVLDCAMEIIVIAACTCQPQDVFVMPHPAASKSLVNYLQVSFEVQRHKEALSRSLGSDPLTGLLTYCEWLREGRGDRHRRWCLQNHVMHIRMERVHRLAHETAMKLGRHVKAMPTFQEMETLMATKDYVNYLTHDEFKIFRLRALMLGSFPQNLMVGGIMTKGSSEIDARTLVFKKVPPALRSKEALQEVLGLDSKDIETINLQPAGAKKSSNNVEIVFKPVGGESIVGPDGQPPPVLDQEPLHPSVLLHDVHFGVKALQNAKQGGSLMVDRPESDYANSTSNGGDASYNTLELNLRGKYEVNWYAPRGDHAVNFSKTSILRNAAPITLSSSTRLYAVTNEIAKILTKRGTPFYSADRSTFLPFTELQVGLLLAAFARAEVVSFKRVDYGAYHRLGYPDEVIDDLPKEDEYVGVEIGRWFEAQGLFKKGTIHLINDIRRYFSQAVTGQGQLSISHAAIRDLMRLHRVGADKEDVATQLPSPLEGLMCTQDRYLDGAVVGSSVLMFPPLVEQVVITPSSSLLYSSESEMDIDTSGDESSGAWSPDSVISEAMGEDDEGGGHRSAAHHKAISEKSRTDKKKKNGALSVVSPRRGLSPQDLVAIKGHIIDILHAHPVGIGGHLFLWLLAKRVGSQPLDLFLPKRRDSSYDRKELEAALELIAGDEVILDGKVVRFRRSPLGEPGTVEEDRQAPGGGAVEGGGGAGVSSSPATSELSELELALIQILQGKDKIKCYLAYQTLHMCHDVQGIQSNMKEKQVLTDYASFLAWARAYRGPVFRLENKTHLISLAARQAPSSAPDQPSAVVITSGVEQGPLSKSASEEKVLLALVAHLPKALETPTTACNGSLTSIYHSLQILVSDEVLRAALGGSKMKHLESWIKKGFSGSLSSWHQFPILTSKYCLQGNRIVLASSKKEQLAPPSAGPTTVTRLEDIEGIFVHNGKEANKGTTGVSEISGLFPPPFPLGAVLSQDISFISPSPTPVPEPLTLLDGDCEAKLARAIAAALEKYPERTATAETVLQSLRATLPIADLQAALDLQPSQAPTGELLSTFAGSSKAHAHVPALASGRVRIWLLSPDVVDYDMAISQHPYKTRVLITVIDMIMKGTGRRRKLRQLYTRLQEEYTHEALNESFDFLGVNQEVFRQWLLAFQLPIVAFDDSNKSVEIISPPASSSSTIG